MEVFPDDKLTLYHTIPTLNDLEKEVFDHIVENTIFSFSHNVLYPSKNNFQIFSHANALNLD